MSEWVAIFKAIAIHRVAPNPTRSLVWVPAVVRVEARFWDRFWGCGSKMFIRGLSVPPLARAPASGAGLATTVSGLEAA